MRERLAALEQYLPDDPGRQRPFNDERRIIFLADVFEDAGGKAVVYAGGYHDAESTADTAFRRFAQQFYAFFRLVRPAGSVASLEVTIHGCHWMILLSWILYQHNG